MHNSLWQTQYLRYIINEVSVLTKSFFPQIGNNFAIFYDIYLHRFLGALLLLKENSLQEKCKCCQLWKDQCSSIDTDLTLSKSRRRVEEQR